MSKEVALQVAMRCRPFSEDNAKLGVMCDETGDQNVVITRPFNAYQATAFNHCWWSAYNYEKHLKDEEDQVTIDMLTELPHVTQEDVYERIGKAMLDNLIKGQAIVMFAYGLSGAGKTYTVFGPDDPKRKDAWFKSATPQKQWGLFPRIAYEMLNLANEHKKDGWVVRVKYFQNVVHDVIDLFSDKKVPERHPFKEMHKDIHGFMDIRWIKPKVITSWDELLKLLEKANKLKYIAPTQFNPSSTRGHCILFYEVDMPMKMRSGKKVIKTARMYVCDLAGAEPAHSVHYANYHIYQTSHGTEYKYIGPHEDKKKTHELVEQGKKINLSLSEMATFFREMSKLLKKKKKEGNGASLTANDRVHGCNSYFLGKFLKLTMLQAHCYLFAAIRPEERFQTFTEQTVEFASNASVIKLKPKNLNQHIDAKKDKYNRHGRRASMWLEDDEGEDHEMLKSLREELAQLRDHIAGRTTLSSSEKQHSIDILNADKFLTEEQRAAATAAVEAAETKAELDTIRRAVLLHNHTAVEITEIGRKAKLERRKSQTVDEADRTKMIDTIQENDALSDEQKRAGLAAIFAAPHYQQLTRIQEVLNEGGDIEEIRKAALEDDHVEAALEDELWTSQESLHQLTYEKLNEKKELNKKYSKLNLSMKLKVAATKKKLQDSRENLESKTRQNKSLASQIEQIKLNKSQEIETMQLEKKNISQALNETQSKLAQIQTKVGILQTEKRRRTTALEEKNAMIEALQTKIDKQMIKLNTMQSTNNDMSHEISTMKDKLYQNDAKIVHLEETIKQNKLSNLESKKEMQEYFQSEIINLNTENRDEIEKLKSSHRDALQTNQFTIAEKTSTIKTMQVDIVSLNKTIQTLQNNIENMEKRSNSAIEDEAKKWEIKLSQIEKGNLKEIDRMKVDMKDMYDRKINQMKSQLEFQKKSVAEITTLHEEELKREREELTTQNQSTINKLIKDLDREKERPLIVYV